MSLELAFSQVLPVPLTQSRAFVSMAHCGQTMPGACNAKNWRGFPDLQPPPVSSFPFVGRVLLQNPRNVLSPGHWRSGGARILLVGLVQSSCVKEVPRWNLFCLFLCFRNLPLLEFVERSRKKTLWGHARGEPWTPTCFLLSFVSGA